MPERPAPPAPSAPAGPVGTDGDPSDSARSDPSTAPALSVRSLRRTFPADPPVAALDGVDLDVATGSVTAILGPSGSGKTTLLRVLAGIDRADDGTVVIGGAMVDGNGSYVVAERRRVGLVPQQGALFPHLDVARNVGFGLHKVPRAERARRVAELLELVGLAGMGARRPYELSGGQAQRVALARALAPKPDVVLLDEPFSALDASLRSSLRSEVADMLRSTGTTAVLVTHDQDEAMSLADTVAIMRAGRIVQSGTPDELYRRPDDLWVADFLGDAVLLDGELLDDVVVHAGQVHDGQVHAGQVHDGQVHDGEVPIGGELGGLGATRFVRCVFGDVPASLAATAPPVAGPVRLCCRPEQLWPSSLNGKALASTDPSGSAVRSGRGAAGSVTRTEFRGSVIDVEVRLASGTVSARWPSSLPAIEVGDAVELVVLGAGVAFLPRNDDLPRNNADRRG